MTQIQVQTSASQLHCASKSASSHPSPCSPPRRRNIEKFDRPLYAQVAVGGVPILPILPIISIHLSVTILLIVPILIAFLCVPDQIWKRIISSGHRTLDGATADYFYIPVDFRCGSCVIDV